MAFDTLKACLLQAPILGFPTEEGRFILDTDASLFAVGGGGGGGGILNKLQDDREVVIAYTSRSLRLSQRRYCTTRREMLAAVSMCTHFCSYLRGAQFTLRTDHRSLWWLQKFRNSDGMLARWYMLLGQFSITFEYRPGAPHTNADGLSRHCWTNRLHLRLWMILWMPICCLNYPEKRGSQPPISTKSLLTSHQPGRSQTHSPDFCRPVLSAIGSLCCGMV